jgi:glycosyltransferase involved in cell wall biosynthesis
MDSTSAHSRAGHPSAYVGTGRDDAGRRLRIAVIHSNASYLTGLRLPLLRHLSLGADVVALAPAFEAWHREILDRHGIRAVAFRLDPTGLNPFGDAFAMLGLARTLRTLAVDIVITNTIKPVIFGTFAAQLAGVPRRFALISGLGYAFTDVGGRPGLKKRVVRAMTAVLYRAAFARNERVIFQNRDDVAELVDAGICRAAKVAVVDGSGVDVDEFRPTGAEPRPTYVMVSRLLHEKGVMDYLRAARMVKSRIPDATFLLVGAADRNPSAVRYADLQPYLEDRTVEWAGAVRDVRPFLARASIFVLPSYREGFPRSTLEAMAAGLAVVTTDVPGCRETVRRGRNGILVPVRDPDALAEALVALAGDLPRVAAMGRASRTIVETSYDVDVIHAQFDAILAAGAAVTSEG